MNVILSFFALLLLHFVFVAEYIFTFSIIIHCLAYSFIVNFFFPLYLNCRHHFIIDVIIIIIFIIIDSQCSECFKRKIESKEIQSIFIQTSRIFSFLSMNVDFSRSSFFFMLNFFSICWKIKSFKGFIRQWCQFKINIFEYSCF